MFGINIQTNHLYFWKARFFLILFLLTPFSTWATEPILFQNEQLKGISLYKELATKPYLENPDLVAKILGEPLSESDSNPILQGSCEGSRSALQSQKTTFYLNNAGVVGSTTISLSKDDTRTCGGYHENRYKLDIQDADKKSCVYLKDLMKEIPWIKQNSSVTTQGNFNFIEGQKEFEFGLMGISVTTSAEPQHIDCIHTITFYLKERK